MGDATDTRERQRIKGIIVGMRQSAMEQHDYGLFMSPSRVRADAFRDVLITTGLADEAMVAEHETDVEAIRSRLAALAATLEAKETNHD